MGGFRVTLGLPRQYYVPSWAIRPLLAGGHFWRKRAGNCKKKYFLFRHFFRFPRGSITCCRHFLGRVGAFEVTFGTLSGDQAPKNFPHFWCFNFYSGGGHLAIRPGNRRHCPGTRQRDGPGTAGGSPWHKSSWGMGWGARTTAPHPIPHSDFRPGNRRRLPGASLERVAFRKK